MRGTDKPFNVSFGWETRLDPDHTRRSGCNELHGVSFMPNEHVGGPRGVVTVQIPETSDELFIEAMEIATQARAWVTFCCDTRCQAHEAACKAAEMLPKHSRVPLESALRGPRWERSNEFAPRFRSNPLELPGQPQADPLRCGSNFLTGDPGAIPDRTRHTHGKPNANRNFQLTAIKRSGVIPI